MVLRILVCMLPSLFPIVGYNGVSLLLHFSTMSQDLYTIEMCVLSSRLLTSCILPACSQSSGTLALDLLLHFSVMSSEIGNNDHPSCLFVFKLSGMFLNIGDNGIWMLHIAAHC